MTVKLPPLPEPAFIDPGRFGAAFSLEQMERYAQVAVTVDRKRIADGKVETPLAVTHLQGQGYIVIDLRGAIDIAVQAAHERARAQMEAVAREQREPKTLRAADAKKLLGIGTSTLWKLARDDDFPKRRHLGTRAVGWDRDELLAWLKKSRRG